ncbi:MULTISPECIES: hypothetical protein [unclassified Achromobacter]|uniref:hypothetical protein n=1 Tax=unclassified Achromobacter TaxID=2626865 RepID=UPI000B517729|nr:MULTISPECIES: hypothetical protein [unclassified Achromobacter]OWT80311.1 hypothetical protein CEY05_02550 [Achromobacter sp. HZ34]
MALLTALVAAGLPAASAALAAEPGPAASVQETLNTAMNQIVEQYVDQLDSRTLAVSGLRGLAKLPAGGDAAGSGSGFRSVPVRADRKAFIDRAIAAEASADGIAAQNRILADEIMRFPQGAQRDAALAAALPEGLGAMVVTTARVYRANGARLDTAGVTPDMSLDPQTRQFTVRAEIAADFNADLQQRIAAEAAAAPPGTDLAQLAALAAIRESGRKTPQGPGTPARRDDIGMKTP